MGNGIRDREREMGIENGDRGWGMGHRRQG